MKKLDDAFKQGMKALEKGVPIVVNGVKINQAEMLESKAV